MRIRGAHLLAVAIAAAALLAVPALAGSHHVKFPSRCTNSVYRPHHFVAACGDAGIRVKGIRWRHYGFDFARGRGTALTKRCSPDCASGGLRRDRVKVRLYRPRRCANVGGYHFTRVWIKYLVADPPVPGGVARFPFPCSLLG